MNGVELIAAERRRQVEEEGWTTEHDQGHPNGELAVVAAELAVDGTGAEVKGWNFEEDMWGLVAKHGWDGTVPDGVRKLVIAGALIAAEIDRVVEAPAQEKKDG